MSDRIHEQVPGRPSRDPYGEVSAGASAGRVRIVALDVIRGFALCGILVANVQPIAHVGDQPVSGVEADAWMGLLVEQRFFPIFSLLFGVGFSLLLDSAAARAARPRVVLVRRLVALFVIGLAHFVLLWHGDILSTYAVVGLLILLPSSWLPRAAVAVSAPVLVIASLLLGGERLVLVAGLFLLGSALVRYGVVQRMESSVKAPAVLGLVLAAGAVPVLWWQSGGALWGLTAGSLPRGTGFSASMATGGLLVAGVYVCGLLLLLRTPLRAALLVVFAPLGRMALTHYLTATALVLAASQVIGGQAATWSSAMVLLLAAGILAGQWLFSTLWLRRFRQGPLEWLWRWATWATRPPLRRRS
jgi:uncharacterized protein